MTEVYVIGADMIKFGRYPDCTPAQLGAEAALLALDDAGLTIKDADVLYCASVFNAASSMGQQVLRQIGQTRHPVRQCLQRLRLGRDRLSRGFYRHQERDLRRRAGGRAGQEPPMG